MSLKSDLELGFSIDFYQRVAGKATLKHVLFIFSFARNKHDFEVFCSLSVT